MATLRLLTSGLALTLISAVLTGCAPRSDRPSKQDAGAAGASTAGGSGAGGSRAGGSGSAGIGASGSAGTAQSGSAGAGGAASGSSGASSAGSAGAAMGGSAGAVVTLPTPCENPRELAPGSGYRRCDNGLVHRPTVGVCPAYEAKSETFGPSMLPDEDECFMDADCDAEPLGFCVKGVVQYGAALVPNRCAYACTVDTECPSGTLCLCAEDRGTCTGPASCTSDADCTGAAVCAAFVAGCREPAGFSCQSSEDQCQVFSDCPSGLTCQALLGGPRRCSLPPCAG